MAEELVEEFATPVGVKHGIEAITLIPGGGGVFDVEVDGEQIFSKREVGRHPEPGEIARLIKSRRTSGP